MEPIERVLKRANLTVNDINKVILVGGTCKIPKIQQMIKDTFPSSEICTTVLPEHVVAMGAAIQGTYHIKPHPPIPCTTENIVITVSVSI